MKQFCPYFSLDKYKQYFGLLTTILLTFITEIRILQQLTLIIQCFSNLHLCNYCCILSTAGTSVHQVWEPRVRVHGASVRAGEAWTGSPARLFTVSVVWPHTDSGRAVCVQVSAHRTGRHEYTRGCERGRGQLDCPGFICVVVNKEVSYMYMYITQWEMPKINDIVFLDTINLRNNGST